MHHPTNLLLAITKGVTNRNIMLAFFNNKSRGMTDHRLDKCVIYHLPGINRKSVDPFYKDKFIHRIYLAGSWSC